LKKKTFTAISYLYSILVFGSFCIWGYLVEKEEGVIDPTKHEMPLILFVGLMFIGVVLAGVDFNSLKDKGNKITRKSVLTGIVIGLLFVLWGVVRSLD
jgi:DMSO/TMAO reductase YedYZ heme-binding membrane subunit